MKRALATIVALVAAQALLIAIWFAVEGGRTPPSDAPAGGDVAPRRTTAMDQPSPDLVLRRPDGTTWRLGATRGQPLVLHFWATWCPPCREELPGLLAYAAEGDVRVLAVTVDPAWEDVRAALGGELPPPVVRAEASDVEEAFDVRALPVTFVIDAAGDVRLRLDGPRDWRSSAVRDEVRRAAGR